MKKKVGKFKVSIFVDYEILVGSYITSYRKECGRAYFKLRVPFIKSGVGYNSEMPNFFVMTIKIR